MDEKQASLVPYKSSLAPADATYKEIYVIVPNGVPFEGHITIALTKDAVWVVSPKGQYEEIPLKHIEDVKLNQFQGFTYKHPQTGDVIAPNDTAGVTIEYRTFGTTKSRVSILTRFPNAAHQLIRLITEAKEALYRQTLSETKNKNTL